MTHKAFDPDEPRDETGKWTDGGGSDGGGDGKGEHPGAGYSKGAYLDKHGVIHTSNVYDAQRALFEDRKVELSQVKQISTLIKRLGETALEMAEHHETAPTFNLCNVSIAGTNLFCADQIGIPRVEMPVIKASKTKEFIKYLKSQGYEVENGREEARNLRASQNEISGEKVAAAMKRIKEEGFYKRLVVSKDDYILDGHHTWAGQLARDAKDGDLENDGREVKIARVNISITKLIAEAEKWTGGAGKKPASEKPKQLGKAQAMPLPKPHKDEAQSDFISRCMTEAYGDDAPDDRTQDQAVAMCHQAWRDKDKTLQTGPRNKQDETLEPELGESEDDFMDRCMDELGDEDACQAIWDDSDTPDGDNIEESADGLKHKTHAGKLNGLEFVLSDETPDRMEDIIASDGWDLSNFKKNPIALFNHKSDFPIGRWRGLRVEDKQLRGHLQLAPEGTSPRIDEIRKLIEAGILRAVSVGFRPIEHESLDKKNPFSGHRYTKSELVETSLVSVPANPNALAVAKSLQISPATLDLVFAKHGTMNSKIKRRGLTGEHAKRSRNGKGSAMSGLAQRITDLETQIVAKRDLLEDLLSKMDDSNVSDADLETNSRLNAEIAQFERTRTALMESERLLAKTVDGTGNVSRSRALSTTVLSLGGEQKIAAPAVISQRKKDLDMLDYIVRAGVVTYKSKAAGRPIDETRQAIYGEDDGTKAVVELVSRAASAPALTTVTGWAAELAQTTYADLMPLLMPKAILTQLAPKGLTLGFGAAGRIVIPTRSRTPSLAGSFVGEGLPIPVRQGAFTSQTLTPKKMAVISTWTREMGDHSIPSIEGLIREAIQQDTSVAIDSVLIDANPATTIRPAGLLNGVSKTTPTSGGGIAAFVGDITGLINAISLATFGNIRNLVWLANQTDILRASMLTATNTGIFPFAAQIAAGNLNGIPIIASGTVPVKTLILVDAADFVVVGGEAPRMEMSDQATLHMEDTTPLDLVASPSTVAAPQRSLFQTDSLALRMVMPLNWTQRRAGTIAWTDTVTW
jgi:HK97 family phage prohead protease/HK97 family phage major capsid protein